MVRVRSDCTARSGLCAANNACGPLYALTEVPRTLLTLSPDLSSYGGYTYFFRCVPSSHLWMCSIGVNLRAKRRYYRGTSPAIKIGLGIERFSTHQFPLYTKYPRSYHLEQVFINFLPNFRCIFLKLRCRKIWSRN